MDWFDFTDPGFLGYMDSEGYLDTDNGAVARVAEVLNRNQEESISAETFMAACMIAGVDPYSFTEEDFDSLQKLLR